MTTYRLAYRQRGTGAIAVRVTRREEAKVMPRKVAATLAMGLLLWSGCVALDQPAPTTTTPSPFPSTPTSIHEHAAFQLYIENQAISFRHCVFDLKGCPSRGINGTGYIWGHMQVNDGHPIIHIEGEEGLTLTQFFEYLQVDFNDDFVKLDPMVHNNHSARDNATHEWQFWLDRCADGPDNWEPQDRMSTFHPRQHDRMLFTYTARGSNATSLKSQLDSVPSDAAIEGVAKDKCVKQATAEPTTAPVASAGCLGCPVAPPKETPILTYGT